MGRPHKSIKYRYLTPTPAVLRMEDSQTQQSRFERQVWPPVCTRPTYAQVHAAAVSEDDFDKTEFKNVCAAVPTAFIKCVCLCTSIYF